MSIEIAYDITMDEARRRTHVLEALGNDWDPIEALQGEEQANDMLYSGLDEQQLRIYKELATAGILPFRSDDDLTKPVKR
jgi:hypothetical protein